MTHSQGWQNVGSCHVGYQLGLFARSLISFSHGHFHRPSWSSQQSAGFQETQVEAGRFFYNLEAKVPEHYLELQISPAPSLTLRAHCGIPPLHILRIQFSFLFLPSQQFFNECQLSPHYQLWGHWLQAWECQAPLPLCFPAKPLVCNYEHHTDIFHQYLTLLSLWPQMLQFWKEPQVHLWVDVDKRSVSVDEAEKKLLTNPGLFLLTFVLLGEKRNFLLLSLLFILICFSDISWGRHVHQSPVPTLFLKSISTSFALQNNRDPSVHFSLVPQLCPNLSDPMDCRTPGFPVHHQLLDLAQTHVHQVGDAIQPSHLCHPLLLPSIFPSIRVFSKESVLCTRWPKY